MYKKPPEQQAQSAQLGVQGHQARSVLQVPEPYSWLSDYTKYVSQLSLPYIHA